MTGSPPAGAPIPPPQTPAAIRPGEQRPRPWWSEIDVLLAIPWFVGAQIVASFVSIIAITLGGGNIDDNPVYAIFFGTLIFQALQFAYPWLVSLKKGLGIETDWRFVSQLPADIFAGMVMAIGCFLGAQAATLVAAALVGLDDTNDASNTDILVDNQSSAWIIGIIFLIVVGAPLVEELLFRGLILRILENSFGSVFAIIASSVLFAIPHWQFDASWQETVVLLSALGVVGLVLAIGAVVTDRLGPCVIAHFIFNATGTTITLFG